MPHDIDRRTLSRILCLGTTILIATSCADLGAPEERAIIAGSALADLTPIAPVFSGRFERGRNAPRTESATLPSTYGNRVLRVHNAGVSSASVLVNGSMVFRPSDFSRQATELSASIPDAPQTTLQVTVAGKPGGYLDISLEGSPLFCTGEAIAGFSDLQSAVDATPAGGTVLVCDGEHFAELVTVSRPMTIRSRNSGRATLVDTGSYVPARFQQGRPVITVNGAQGGTVRIADIGFRIAGRGILATGIYDRVVLDSVRFISRDDSTAIGIMATQGTSPGRRVDVVRSTFEGIRIGAFAADTMELNFSDSRSSRSGGGVVVHSTSGSWGTISGNDFSFCRIGCIRLLSAGAPGILVANNTLRSAGVRASRGAIVISPTGAVANGVVTVENNVIESARTELAATTPAGWEFPSGVELSNSLMNSAATHQINHNDIRNAYSGVQSTLLANVHDNVITGGMFAFRQTSGRSITFTRNDANGLLGSFEATAIGGNYRCNWWGSASGPIQPPAATPASMYTPWATQPVARNDYSCDGAP
jgi:hypothetical protein